MKKYIKEWEEGIIAETRVGEYGIAHICINNLLNGENLEKQKERVEELVYDVLYRQALKKANEIPS